TGRPVYNAIVWQCRRTSDYCREIEKDDFANYIKENTGLVVDAYFSATKVKWILDNVKGVREKAENGDILFGTVDSWLVWKLTGGKVHATDYTNASRTMMFNIKNLCWDENILNYFNIPKSILPQVKFSDSVFGYANIEGENIPIAGVAGDQQAALFGQKCFEKGDAKNTYGTGCFLLMNTGEKIIKSKSGLLSTIGIAANNKILYALEGSVFIGGAVIQWLRDELKFFTESCDSEYFGNKVSDNGGVYVVPAFTGLGAPHWDMYARGAIFGLTRGANKDHIIRAAIEALAYQTNDVISAMENDIDEKIEELRVDGGASANKLLVQFQADLTNVIVRRPMIRETTALGVAYLAGLSTGFWKSIDEIKNNWSLDKVFTPEINSKKRAEYLKGWKKAIDRAKNWEE
ncbi:MAG: glycerol kinase GlpK, partial [Oscillospiraceae bacterium]